MRCANHCVTQSQIHRMKRISDEHSMSVGERNDKATNDKDIMRRVNFAVVARIVDIVLTYSILFVVVAAVYPLLNKELLETVTSTNASAFNRNVTS